MIKYYSKDNPDVLLDIAGDCSAICRKYGYNFIEIEDPKLTEIKTVRQEYLDNTKALCELAGEEYKGKLEDVDYKRIIYKASSNIMTGIIAASLVY